MASHCMPNITKPKCMHCDQNANGKCTIEKITWQHGMKTQTLEMFYCNNHKDNFINMYKEANNISQMSIEDF